MYSDVMVEIGRKKIEHNHISYTICKYLPDGSVSATVGDLPVFSLHL